MNMLNRVLRPKTAAFLIGAAVCINCAEIVDSGCDEERPKTPSSEDYMGSASSLTSEDYSRVSTSELTQSLLRPPTPANSECSDAEAAEEEEAPKSRQDQIIAAVSNIKNNLSAILFAGISSDDVEGTFAFKSFYENDSENDLELDRDCDCDRGAAVADYNCETEEVSSSLNSLVKTLGGSNNSASRVALPRDQIIEEELEGEIDDGNDNVDDNGDDYESDNVIEYRPVTPKIRSDSPYTRQSRVNSIESEEFCSLIKGKLAEVSNAEQLAQFDKIASMAGPVLKNYTKNAGLLLFEHLLENSKQINVSDSSEDSTSRNIMILEQLIQIYFRIPEGGGDIYEYEDLILKCLEVTLVVNNEFEYSQLRLVRDSLILLMLNNRFIFDDEFFADQSVHKLLRRIVIKADHFGHLDTLDYIRQLMNFPNLTDLQKCFKIVLKLPERKMSDDFYLPLEAENLKRVLTSKLSRNNKQISSSNSSKDLGNSFNKAIYMISRNIWDNRRILIAALLIAIMAQYLIVQK